MRVRGGYVESDWGQVHYLTAGTSGPWVALFHESPLSSRVYQQVLPILGGHARVVAFDTPGYGASDPPPRNGFEIPEYAAVLARAASALGMADVVFGGVHTGASLAIEAAHVFDRGARAVVLSGVALFTPEERADFLANWTPQAPYDVEGRQFAWAVERYRRIWPKLTTDMLQLAVTELMRVVDRYDWGYQAAFRHDPGLPLAALDIPVLLLDAEFDLLADKDPVALELAKQARLVTLPGLPGQPHLRAPAQYAHQIAEFLRDVAAR
ncbi:hypothetical protein Vqi01_50220 [Micromonospora qiuiae]|uniref:AB hydrolase-1 domain-containing protein n=1 Tax=Micromonospora qiuiae TaxID=502268 RepID=A0ABQ4JGV5_9ACTN|nr:alpha/beta hydrolase [Micromonospora qiuiae]GIJ29860.1 hypothetical protein Vqi01_50220 [Micromonospora qiuiae]